MALIDSATLVVNSANYFLAEPGTPKPTDYRNISDPWDNLGHTDLDEVAAISSEGGDVTVLGTLQKKQLRTVRSQQTDSFAIILQQFDEPSVKLYFGSNAETGPDGAVRRPNDPAPTRKAFLAVYYDGENVLPIYAPLVEISRGDDIDFGDTENFAGLPLSIQPLNWAENTWPYEFGPIVTLDGAPVEDDGEGDGTGA